MLKLLVLKEFQRETWEVWLDGMGYDDEEEMSITLLVVRLWSSV